MRYIFLTILIFSGGFVYGQQFSLPSQPSRNMVYLNPAYTGIYETMVAALMHRESMSGFPGNPQFQDLEIHAPLKKQSVALGVQAYHQQIGGRNSSEVFLNYCHRIEMGSSKLAFALKLGAESNSFNQLALPSADYIDPNFESNSFILPNFGFGISYYSKNFFSGISVPYLLGVNAGTDGNAAITSPNINSMDFVASAGGKIAVGYGSQLEPTGVFIYKLSSITYEAVINYNLNNKLVFGAGYRSEKAVLADLGYYINNQVSIMYSYDYGLNGMVKSSNGSHEINILFYFGYKIKSVSPRDF